MRPTLWFRNTWSWGGGGSKPVLRQLEHRHGSLVEARHTDPLLCSWLNDYYFYCDQKVPLLFTENEANNARLFSGANAGLYVKDGINDHLVHGRIDAVNPALIGTKVSPRCQLRLPGGGTQVLHLRLIRTGPDRMIEPFGDFDDFFQKRIEEADAFYDVITPARLKRQDPARVILMRQALAGMLWTTQYFDYDVDQWLEEHHVDVLSGGEHRQRVRNGDWFHAYGDDSISMPDQWEYLWSVCCPWRLWRSLKGMS